MPDHKFCPYVQTTGVIIGFNWFKLIFVTRIEICFMFNIPAFLRCESGKLFARNCWHRIQYTSVVVCNKRSHIPSKTAMRIIILTHLYNENICKQISQVISMKTQRQPPK